MAADQRLTDQLLRQRTAGPSSAARTWFNRGTSMRVFQTVIAASSALLLVVVSASAQNKSGVDKLYILNCGEGIAGDISRWSPGVGVGEAVPVAVNCYL